MQRLAKMNENQDKPDEQASASSESVEEEKPKLPEITKEKLKQILKEHKKWLESDGKKGEKANLREAKLQRAKLGSANLREANLQGAYLWRAKLQKANFRETDLRGLENLTIEQLKEVKTLYKAKLDPELMEKVKKCCPHLLEIPEKNRAN